MLVETDSPDIPDSSHHAQRNEPAYILQVINKIAELKNDSPDTVVNITTKNAREIYNLRKK